MLDSDRLRYRRLTLDDVDFIVALLNSAGWLANIGDRGVHNELEAADYLLQRIFPATTAPWLGPHVVMRRDDPKPLGTVGVYARPGLDVPDLGFALLPEAQGRGYATEAGQRLLDFVAGYGVVRLSAITLPQNRPSIRVLDKLGFRQEGTVRLPDDAVELNYYVRTAVL